MNRSSHFANLSGLAYDKFDDKLTKKLKDLKYTTIKYVSNKGAQAIYLSNKEEQVIAFRGTEPKQFSDIKADLKAWKIKSKTSGRVHDGFYDEVEKVWPELIKLIKPKNLPLYMCGHSLGGAMATIAASRLKTEALYTFGSPRVGNKKWLDHVNVTHYRWRNNNDLVTKVPLWLMGFRHHGQLMYINYHGNLRNGLSTWQLIKDWFRGHCKAVSKFELFDGLRDHSIARYIKRTKENLY
jgi:triacylglycerol lipase